MGKKITKDRFDKFLRNAEPRAELHSDIPGLFLIKLQGGGAWRMRYVDPTGAKTAKGTPKRITATLADATMPPAEATELAREWRQKLKEGRDPLAERQRQQLQAHEQQQRDSMRQYANTGRFFEEIYSPHLLAFSTGAKGTLNIISSNFEHLFDRDMDYLTTADIRAWENKRKEEGVSRSSLSRAFGAFKAMLNFAAGVKKNDPNDNPVIGDNPLKNVNLSRMTVSEREQQEKRKEELNLTRDLLGPEERKKLQQGLALLDQQKRRERESSRAHGKPHLPDLSNATYAHWFVPFAHIARLTGMRPGDVRRLRWSDIRRDFRSGHRVLQFTPHKTAHHPNPVEVVFPVTGELATVIDAWRADQDNPESGPVFRSERTGDSIGESAHRRPWAKVKELAGVREDIDFYCFRHNFISDLVNRGLPLMKVARLVGHKDTNMIAENYYRQDLDDMSGLIAALGGDPAPAEEEQQQQEGVQ